MSRFNFTYNFIFECDTADAKEMRRVFKWVGKIRKTNRYLSYHFSEEFESFIGEKVWQLKTDMELDAVKELLRTGVDLHYVERSISPLTLGVKKFQTYTCHFISNGGDFTEIYRILGRFGTIKRKDDFLIPTAFQQYIGAIPYDWDYNLTSYDKVYELKTDIHIDILKGFLETRWQAGFPCRKVLLDAFGVEGYHSMIV